MKTRKPLNSIENLNLMTRQELLDSQRYTAGDAFEQLELLLGSKPEVSGIKRSADLFIVNFSADIISDISYSLEAVTWDMAEVYAKKLEARANSPDDDKHHQYWQLLQEKWSYLEMAVN